MKKAVILFSGGLDSTTCLYLAKSQGFECHPLSFHYGQRHNTELNAAKKIAQSLGLTHKIIELPLGELGGSALTDATQAVPDYTGGSDIPVTYVPARNTIFLAFALAYAEVIGAHDLFIGVSAIDYSHYPDCRPEFIEAFQHLATLATKTSVEGSSLIVHTPLLHLSKADTVRLGASLDVDYSATISCYQADDQGRACGTCDSCILRKKGFLESGTPDPTHYRS